VIRHEMMKRPGYECTQDYLDYGYKELTIPVGPNGGFRIERNALHIWPRGTFMLIALPNFDGSFTCTLFLPSQGPDSFETLGENPERILAFFQKHFADVIPLLTDPVETFNANPTGHMVTVKCFPWHVADRALLLGDAAHAIVPFFGQGMNCGFEDCTIFDELLEKHGKLNSQFFAQFSQLRKPHTDGIADMAIENFVEMRDKVGDTRFLMEKSVEKILQQHFPTEYISRYALVTFSRLPYRVAYEAGIVESEILGELCRNIKQAEEVDLDQAARLIRAKLNPVLQHQKGLNHGS
jgi:kynurenine 3-monooxygenase